MKTVTMNESWIPNTKLVAQNSKENYRIITLQRVMLQVEATKLGDKKMIF